MPDLGSRLLPHNTRQKLNQINCVYLDIFVYFGSATKKLSHFSALPVAVSTFRKSFGCLILVWAVVRPGPLLSSSSTTRLVHMSRDLILILF